MGIPNLFNDIIQRHLDVFAAWVPIVDKYKLGDYGIFSDGVFTRLGNIVDEFQVTIKEGTGEEASIDFSSTSSTVTKFTAGGQVVVTPGAEAVAKIEIEFAREKSFLVKSPVITVKTIDNVNEVAKQLRKQDEWDGKWKVVSKVYNAQDAVIVSTIGADTKLIFSGDVTALGQLKLGSAGVNMSSTKELGLKIHGKNGVIGLGLFRIKSKIFGGWKVEVLTDDAGNDAPIFVDPADAGDDLSEETSAK